MENKAKLRLFEVAVMTPCLIAPAIAHAEEPAPPTAPADPGCDQRLIEMDAERELALWVAYLTPEQRKAIGEAAIGHVLELDFSDAMAAGCGSTITHGVFCGGRFSNGVTCCLTRIVVRR